MSPETHDDKPPDFAKATSDVPDSATVASDRPDYLSFQCPLTVEAADDSEKKMPRFSMVAYTGDVMRIPGFPHPVVVDLEGLVVDRQDIPVRLDHNPRQGVGHTQRMVIERRAGGGQVHAEGLISRDTSWARDVAKSGSNGFPWQASIGAAVVEAEFVPQGQRVHVNGRTFDGPLHVVRRAILKEISFVDTGADAATSARIAATANTHKEPHPMTPRTTPATGSDGGAGDVIVQGDLVGIAKLDIAGGALAVTGVFDLPKTTGAGEAIGAGVKVYWDVAQAVAKTDDESGANKYLGKTVRAAGDNDATVRVRLEQ